MAKKTEPKDLLSDFINAALNRYETDTTLETQKGVDIEVEGVGTFTILRANGRNQKFIKAYREKVLPYAESEEAKTIAKKDEVDPKLEELNRAVFAEVMIVGLKDLKGKSIPYDDKAKDAVKRLLANTPDLYFLLQAESVNAVNFRKQYKAEEKN